MLPFKQNQKPLSINTWYLYRQIPFYCASFLLLFTDTEIFTNWRLMSLHRASLLVPFFPIAFVSATFWLLLLYFKLVLLLYLLWWSVVSDLGCRLDVENYYDSLKAQMIATISLTIKYFFKLTYYIVFKHNVIVLLINYSII